MLAGWWIGVFWPSHAFLNMTRMRLQSLCLWCCVCYLSTLWTVESCVWISWPSLAANIRWGWLPEPKASEYWWLPQGIPELCKITSQWTGPLCSDLLLHEVVLETLLTPHLLDLSMARMTLLWAMQMQLQLRLQMFSDFSAFIPPVLMQWAFSFGFMLSLEFSWNFRSFADQQCSATFFLSNIQLLLFSFAATEISFVLIWTSEKLLFICFNMLRFSESWFPFIIGSFMWQSSLLISIWLWW